MIRNLSTAVAMSTLVACGPAASEGEAGAPAAAAAKPVAELSRLDCGTVTVSDLSVFSTAGNYKGVTKTLTSSCYLIRHGEDLMLWDTGLSGASAGKGPQADGVFTMELERRLVDQLAAIGIAPGDIDIVGISHFHGDHTGQLADFHEARLLTGKGDWDAITAANPDPRLNVAPYSHWAKGGGAVQPVTGDLDVFGDGSVVMLDLAGHTPGHMGLKLQTGGGTVLLSGDVTHFRENYANDGMPTWNTDKEASLAAIRRFKQIARDSGATVVIQHEPGDIAKVPAAAASK